MTTAGGTRHKTNYSQGEIEHGSLKEYDITHNKCLSKSKDVCFSNQVPSGFCETSCPHNPLTRHCPGLKNTMFSNF